VEVNDDQNSYKGGVSSIAISRKYLIWVSGKNSISIINWSTKIKKNLSVSSNQNEIFQEICCVSLSQKGYLLHGRRNGTIHIWDIQKGTVVNQLEGHLRNVSSLTVTRDGRYALSSSWDGTSILWEVESGRKLFQMAAFKDEEWVVLTPEGFFNASPQGEKHINLLKNDEIVNMRELEGLLNRPDIVMEIRRGAEIKKLFRESLMGTQ
jgi:WD40 repeat protein